MTNPTIPARRLRFVWMCSLCVFVAASAVAQRQTLAERVSFKTRPFELSDVRLLPGPLLDLQERNHLYLLSLDVDRLVHNFRVNAGLPSSAVTLGGWEAPTCELRGHFIGHYMTACALMYSATGDEKVKEKGNKVVSALAQCQKALGSKGYLSAFPEEFIDRVEAGKRVWAPYYTLHKLMAGLLDMYMMCGNSSALDVLVGMSRWCKERTDKLSDDQMQNMLRTEFGGISEVLENLASLTRDQNHLTLARRFEKRSFLDPLINGEDKLKGLHVNTHIPQVIGAARGYELTGEKPYLDATTYFWDQVVGKRTFATGGTSNYEHWREDPGHLADQLSQETHENCCTYNMLRLTEHLYSWSGEARFFDYYERALFSGILPTHHPETGGAIMYYVPLKSGLFKMFGVPDSSYFCCNGSGIESFSKLGSNIYHRSGDTIFVNLFVPSLLSWKECGITLRQETMFPEEERTKISVRVDQPMHFTIALRIPSWTAGTASLKINGRQESVSSSTHGYVELARTWKSGDKIEFRLPMRLSLSRMPDDPLVAAVMYGPVVLAGALGDEAMTKEMKNGLGWADVDRMFSMGAAIQVPVLVARNDDLASWIQPVKGKPLTFRTVGAGRPRDVTLVPFYKLFSQRYAVYWDVLSPADWNSRESATKKLPAGTTDTVQIGDAKSERDHNFQAYRFQAGQHEGRNWVKSQLWFRYDLNISPSAPNVLECVYAGADSCRFEILIDGRVLKSESFSGSSSGSLVKVGYDVPRNLVRGKKRVAVMFRAKENKPTPEVYSVAMVTRKR